MIPAKTKSTPVAKRKRESPKCPEPTEASVQVAAEEAASGVSGDPVLGCNPKDDTAPPKEKRAPRITGMGTFPPGCSLVMVKATDGGVAPSPEEKGDLEEPGT